MHGCTESMSDWHDWRWIWTWVSPVLKEIAVGPSREPSASWNCDGVTKQVVEPSDWIAIKWSKYTKYVFTSLCEPQRSGNCLSKKLVNVALEKSTLLWGVSVMPMSFYLYSNKNAVENRKRSKALASYLLAWSLSRNKLELHKKNFTVWILQIWSHRAKLETHISWVRRFEIWEKTIT